MSHFHHRFTAVLFAGSVLFATSLIAAELPVANPEAHGFSQSRLDRIAPLMKTAMDEGKVVGGQTLIARNGRIIHNETWGQRDREANAPMREDTIYRIYSMTKPIAGVALLMLYEEGKFLLNDKVAKYLPELAKLQVATSTADSAPHNEGDEVATRKPSRQPTIRDLMRQTAGFTYGLFGVTPVDRLYIEAGLFGQTTLEDFVNVLGTLPLQYEPGTRWHYSVSVDVQARLVEVISGQSFTDFLSSRLFEPLGMVDTGFVVPEEKRHRLAQLYAPAGSRAGWDGVWKMGDNNNLVVADASISQRYLQEEGFYRGGGSGLVSTARDYLRFAQMLLNGGELDGARYLSPTTVKLMATDHLGFLPVDKRMPGQGFGLGVSVTGNLGDYGELGAEGSYGWGGAAGTRFWIDPENDLIGILMLQSMPHRIDVRDKFRVLTYQAMER